MSKTIDLNADLGEDESEEAIVRDLAMMEIVSSCNIACGGHAGSPEHMKKMLIAAKERDVAAGAHPSYPDRVNFGRITLEISEFELTRSLEKQLKAIDQAAKVTGTKLHHLKPHGALYNDTQDDENLANILTELAASQQLSLVGMPQSLLEEKATASGIPYIAEAFIDRQYTDDARLVSRHEPGAVIEHEEARLAQGSALATSKTITSYNGNSIYVSAQTLCLHSDSSGALATARAMRTRLEQLGIDIEPVIYDRVG